jgi:DNA-binding protein HU-beta
MKKSEMISLVAAQSGLTKADAERAIDSLITVIAQAMLAEDEVTLPGLGKFKTKLRAAREGRNPVTGEPINIDEKVRVVFKQSTALKL